MDIGANRNCFPRPQDQFSEDVAVIHHIEERKTGIDPRCGQDLKESTVDFVVRVAITGPVIVTSAQPRPYRPYNRRLPTSLDRDGAGALRESAPGAGLHCAPGE